jgi:CheY-like chemotaxis protein
LLRKMQLPCEEASDGQIALDMVKEDVNRYTLIMMDNLMPNMDGVHATRAMRDFGFTGIIAGVTGNVMDDDVKEYLHMGADIVYGKPVKQAVLKLLVDHIKKEGPQTRSQSDKKLADQGGKLTWIPK